jgi:hypothetical protein
VPEGVSFGGLSTPWATFSLAYKGPQSPSNTLLLLAYHYFWIQKPSRSSVNCLSKSSLTWKSSPSTVNSQLTTDLACSHPPNSPATSVPPTRDTALDFSSTEIQSDPHTHTRYFDPPSVLQLDHEPFNSLVTNHTNNNPPRSSFLDCTKAGSGGRILRTPPTIHSKAPIVDHWQNIFIRFRLLLMVPASAAYVFERPLKPQALIFVFRISSPFGLIVLLC